MSGFDDDDDAPAPKMSTYPDPPIDECPVALLGFYDEFVVFAMPHGNIRAVKADLVARKLRVDILNQPAGRKFLGYWKDAVDDKFRLQQAAEWFVAKARDAGFWDNSRPQRGPGVWPWRGDVVLHRGCELMIYPADKTKPNIRVSIAEALRDTKGPIYTLKADRPKPEPACPASDGQWVRDQLDAWHFEQIGDEGLTGADVIAGWIGASMLGAVAPFRPHALLYALLGSGKTTLIRFIHALLSAIAGDVLDSFTPAGLQNDLGGNARPVLIDEAEASTNPQGVGPIEAALDLIRKMATGEGSVRKMGTIGGGSLTQTAVGSVMMAAVNPVKFGPADASRVVEARLLPLTMERQPGSAFRPTGDDKIAAMVTRANEIAPALLGRALTSAHRYLADVEALKLAFRQQGEAPRSADLIASLAAGRRLLVADRPLDDAEAAEEAQLWRGLITNREQNENVSNTGADCLAHLMTWPCGKTAGGRLVTIGEQVERRTQGHVSNEDIKEIDATLGAHGLKVKPAVPGDDGQNHPWLLVAHHAPGLDRIFERTAWRDWRRALVNLDALGPEFKTRPGNKQRFGVGLEQRCTAVPLDHWVERFTRG